MFAVIQTGGKQYRVSEGDKLKVEKLEAEEGSSFVFDKVLMTGEGEKVNLGKPYLNGAKVEADILREGRYKKIIVFKFKAKKRYRKKGGHRQPFTEVKITKISG